VEVLDCMEDDPVTFQHVGIKAIWRCMV